MQYDSADEYFARRRKPMSNGDRPPTERQDTGHPELSHVNTNIPVTPGIHNSAYIDPNPSMTAASQYGLPPDRTASGASGAQWNSNYIEPSQSTNGARPSSPTEAAAGARSPEELLRRLSLTVQPSKRPSEADFDPRVAYPGLGLTGHVISATFCVPYKISYSPEGDWVRHDIRHVPMCSDTDTSQELTSRRGTSALFDSFSYLSSAESSWSHTLVGWTGEIDKALPRNATMVNGAANSSVNARPLNKASAPIPVDAKQKPSNPNEPKELHIPAQDRRKLEKQLERDHGGRVSPVWLFDEVSDDDVATLRNQEKWRRYGEHELFTLFHYKQNAPTDGRALRKAWADYYRMNKAFADQILSVYKPGDIILVHDYHLLLLPSLLRQRVPHIYISFFLHIPFPSSEYYRCLNRRKEVLEGVLGANMIGFQAFSYSRHFSSCCTRILGFDSSSAGVDAYGAHVAVDVFPIGINAEGTLQSAFGSPEIEEKIKGLKELYAGKKIIVGRDRLDSVRGVVHKLQSFEIFLEQHPEWHEKVVLIQVTSPTSIEDRDDKTDKTANKISDLVARINGSFGSLSFVPVQHYPQYLSREEYFALLRIADLGLITSVRDGMNTTALEYVVCQRDNHGPLIISEFSGTAGSLGNALHINPWDLSGTANAIDTALKMTEPEKEQAHHMLYEHVTKNTIQAWTSNYLKRLLTNLASFDQSVATPALDKTQMLQQYRNASRRLFMFDYDGTLTPIVKEPGAAIPHDRVLRNLKLLASDPQNNVWIISGRDQAFLEEYMGDISELGLSAEHGSFIRMPNTTKWESLTETYDMSWQPKVMKVFSHFTDKTQGSFIERKKIALTWHYRASDPELGAFMAREAQKHLEATVVKEYEIEVMTGKANLEVRPRFVNKGAIAKRLVKEYGQGADVQPDFVLCLGDDFTDEGMLTVFHPDFVLQCVC